MISGLGGYKLLQVSYQQEVAYRPGSFREKTSKLLVGMPGGGIMGKYKMKKTCLTSIFVQPKHIQEIYSNSDYVLCAFLHRCYK